MNDICFQRNLSGNDNEPYFVMPGPAFLAVLRRVESGDSVEMIYAEVIASTLVTCTIDLDELQEEDDVQED